MAYKSNGKRSRAWWLNAIKWFGKDSIKGIMRGGEVPTHQVKEAVDDLIAEGYISVEGKRGRGHTPKFHLTELGSRYLDRNQDELEERTEEPKPVTAAASNDPLPEAEKPSMYTWKRRLNGTLMYFKDGVLVPLYKVPDKEIERMDAEAEAEVIDHSTAAPGLGVHHDVPQAPEFKGPPMPPSTYGGNTPKRGRPPKQLKRLDESEAFYCKTCKAYTDHPTEGCPDNSTNVPEKAIELGIAIAKHVANNGGIPVDDTQRSPVTPKHDIVRPPIIGDKAAANTPENNSSSKSFSMTVTTEIVDLSENVDIKKLQELIFEGNRLCHLLAFPEINKLVFVLGRIEETE